jgi:hypothetical protein
MQFCKPLALGVAMSIEQTGPVTVAEAEAVVVTLRTLAERAAEHRQATFHFVFAMTADSLADNVETAVDFVSDGADDE